MYSDITLRPLILITFLQWANQFGVTPFLVVQVDEHVKVPREYVKDGMIVLDVSDESTRDLDINPALVSFRTRFSGSEYWVDVPIGCVVGCFSSDPIHQSMRFTYQSIEEIEADLSQRELGDLYDGFFHAQKNTKKHPNLSKLNLYSGSTQTKKMKDELCAPQHTKTKSDSAHLNTSEQMERRSHLSFVKR